MTTSAVQNTTTMTLAAAASQRIWVRASVEDRRYRTMTDPTLTSRLSGKATNKNVRPCVHGTKYGFGAPCDVTCDPVVTVTVKTMIINVHQRANQRQRLDGSRPSG